MHLSLWISIPCSDQKTATYGSDLIFTNVKASSMTVTRSNDVMARQLTRSAFSLHPRGGTRVAASALEIIYDVGDLTMRDPTQ